MKRERYEETTDEDSFAEESLYEGYEEEDLSADPMASDPVRLSRKERRLLKKIEKDENLKRRLRAEFGAEDTVSGEEPVTEGGNEEESKPRRNRVGKGIMTVLSGNILSRHEANRIYPYLLFIAFLAFLYIGNVFRMQQLYRKHDRLTKEVAELRAKSLTIASARMEATRQSSIIREIQRRGLPLKESVTPNKVVVK